MKKIVILIFTIFTILNLLPTANAYADSENVYYAKIQSTGVQFYSLPSENTALFELPYSYFVKVEYIVDDYYKVTYQDLEGYVKKSEVTLMSGQPTNPYASATFSLYVATSLYASPSTSASATATLDTTSTLTYYGTKIGEQVQDVNSWYYAGVTIDGQTYHGYVFSAIVALLSTISTNTETFEIVDESVLIDSSSTKFSGLSTGTQIMLIIAISIPSLLILYFLIKPSKIVQVTKSKSKVKKEKHRVQHGDYFEFDESEL